MIKDMLNKIEKYEYVSFDIFDTLIKRTVKAPTDLFALMELELKSSGISFKGEFKSERIAAERRARLLSTREDVTLDQIYNQLSQTHDHADELKNMEIAYERFSCVVNREMLEVYNRCLEKGKNIYIISDMYLPEDVIKGILLKNGITGYQRLYLSSSIGLTKHRGSLFRHALKDIGIKNKQIIHVGDNKRSDYLMPTCLGIKAILVPHTHHLNFYCERGLQGDSLFSYRTITALINNCINGEESEYWRIGYETLGPLFYGFSAWLLKETKIQKFDKIFFLSRDGYYLKRVFDKIALDAYDTRYLYASRRALIVPMLWKNPDLPDVMASFFIGKRIRVGTFIERVGLEINTYQELLRTCNLHADSVLSASELTANPQFLQFYQQIKNDIIENSKREYQILKQYLKQEGFRGKVAIVDIGWFGNMQRALSDLHRYEQQPIDITGYYVGLTPVRKCVGDEGNKKKGFLFETGKNEELFPIQHCFIALLEMLFLAQHGSVKKYEKTESGIQPVLFPYEYAENQESYTEAFYVSEIQRGALSFSEDMLKHPELRNMEVDPYCAFQALKNLGAYPTRYICELFGNFRSYDSAIKHIAKPDTLVGYLFHPSKLKTDFLNAPWRVGFLRRLFKIPLPYYKIYMFMRKIFH